MLQLPLCVHGALYLTSCCSNQCVLSSGLQMQVPLFKNKKKSIIIEIISNGRQIIVYFFLLTISLSKSTQFTLLWFSLHFLSCHIESWSGQLSLHLMTSQFLKYADLSWILKGYLQVQHPYFNSYIIGTEIKCLSWACASSQRSPPPSSCSPLSLHCFPYTLALLSCSHWANVCLMPTVVRRKHKAKILIFSHMGAHRGDASKMAALEI